MMMQNLLNRSRKTTKYFQARRNITRKDGHQWKAVKCIVNMSRVAEWKRAGPMTQRSEDQNLAVLKVRNTFLLRFFIAYRGIFNFLLGVWKFGETGSLVCDIV